MQLATNPFEENQKDEPEQAEEQEKTRLQFIIDQDVNDLIKKCKSAVQDIKSWESERNEINADMKAKREQLEALGITKQAFALAVKVSKMDESQLDGFWLALQIMLKAVERPIKSNDMQSDLFE